MRERTFKRNEVPEASLIARIWVNIDILVQEASGSPHRQPMHRLRSSYYMPRVLARSVLLGAPLLLNLAASIETYEGEALQGCTDSLQRIALHG